MERSVQEPISGDDPIVRKLVELLSREGEAGSAFRVEVTRISPEEADRMVLEDLNKRYGIED
jgi:hypothetical protein